LRSMPWMLGLEEMGATSILPLSPPSGRNLRAP
jgi:hypothetical protein